MPILKIPHHQGDDAATQATIAWLAEHGIPAGDCFAPSFVDTDARIIYWSACVYARDSKAGRLETGVLSHNAIAALGRYGLDSAALGPGLLAVPQETAMLSEPPAEVVAQAVTV